MKLDQGTVILAGIVGSTAYGLNGPDSDVDRMGVYVAPTTKFFGLHPPVEHNNTFVTIKPDQTFHEALKYARLALKCNPSVLELMWLPEGLYEVCTPMGRGLVGIRDAFLSKKLVRKAYLGYATSQFHRLLTRGDGSFSSDTRKRTAKHARHLLRLLDQGIQLYGSGQLTVKVFDPAWYFEQGEKIANDPQVARVHIGDAEHHFDGLASPLPEHPDYDAVEDWLQMARINDYNDGRLSRPRRIRPGKIISDEEIMARLITENPTS